MSETEHTAIHEAGHAVVAGYLGIPLRGAYMTGDSGSSVLTESGHPDTLGVESWVAALAAGQLAAELAGAEVGDVREGSDFPKALALLTIHSFLSSECAADQAATRGLALAELILRARWGAVERVAEWLQSAGQLSGEALVAAIEGAEPTPLPCSPARVLWLARNVDGSKRAARLIPLLPQLTRESVGLETWGPDWPRFRSAAAGAY